MGDEVTTEPTMSELEVLLSQLDELLVEGCVDEDDALEIAALAGLAERLGADRSQLVDAIAWRQSDVAVDLLRSAWEQLDLSDLIDAVEACADGDVPAQDVEDAIFELDELVAAAVWTGQAAKVKKAAAEIEALIRMVPDPFASLSSYARELARQPGIARDLDVYGYWLAIADAAEWADA
jgi:hypothetical protein